MRTLQSPRDPQEITVPLVGGHLGPDLETEHHVGGLLDLRFGNRPTGLLSVERET